MPKLKLLPGMVAEPAKPKLPTIDEVADDYEANRLIYERDDRETTAVMRAFGRLAALAPAYCPLRRQRETLRAKLADPALEGHPKRPAAIERFMALEAEYVAVRDEVDDLIKTMARGVANLSQRKKDVLASTGRPKTDDGIKWSLAVWSRLIEDVGCPPEDVFPSWAEAKRHGLAIAADAEFRVAHYSN
jgi:hypothetical protein